MKNILIAFAVALTASIVNVHAQVSTQTITSQNIDNSVGETFGQFQPMYQMGQGSGPVATGETHNLTGDYTWQTTGNNLTVTYSASQHDLVATASSTSGGEETATELLSSHTTPTINEIAIQVYDHTGIGNLNTDQRLPGLCCSTGLAGHSKPQGFDGANLLTLDSSPPVLPDAAQ